MYSQTEHDKTTRSLPGNMFLSPGDLSTDSSDSETDSDSVTAPPYSPITSEPSLSDFSSPESEAELTGDDEDINRPGACHRC